MVVIESDKTRGPSLAFLATAEAAIISVQQLRLCTEITAACPAFISYVQFHMPTRRSSLSRDSQTD